MSVGVNRLKKFVAWLMFYAVEPFLAAFPCILQEQEQLYHNVQHRCTQKLCVAEPK